MALACPQSMFRTYIDIETGDFRTSHYVEAPLNSFSPPQEWNLSRNVFRGMITLDTSRFYDTEIADRPRSFVTIPSELVSSDDPRLLGLSMFEYVSNGLYDCHPARSRIPTQIRALNVKESDICVLSMPSPNCSPQVPLTTLFHEVVVELRFQRHLNTVDYMDTTSWFELLPRAVQLYLAPLQNQWLTEWLPALNAYSPLPGTCEICDTMDMNLRRHHMRHHAPRRAIYFCPIPGCPSVLIDQQGLRDHLRQNTHRGGVASMGQIGAFGTQNCFWPLTRAWAAAILGSPQKFHAYIMLHSCAGVALQRTFYAAQYSIVHTSLMEVLRYFRPKFNDRSYGHKIGEEDIEDCEASHHDAPVLTVVRPLPVSVFAEAPTAEGRAGGFLDLLEQNQRIFIDAVRSRPSSRGPGETFEGGKGTQRASLVAAPSVTKSCVNAGSLDSAPESPVSSITPEVWTSLLDDEFDTDMLDATLANLALSPEGEVRPSVALSLPGGVDNSSVVDTACPAEPEVKDFTQEAPEGSPSLAGILAVSAGASASSFPGRQGIAVSGFPGLAPAVFGLMVRMDGLEEGAMFQQQMLDHVSDDHGQMRRTLRMLAEFAGVAMAKPDCGCQCPGKR